MNQVRFNTVYEHLYMNILVVGGGKEQTATGRGGRRRGGIGSDRESWKAEGRHRQRQGEVGGGAKAQAATARDGRPTEGIGSDRERWEAEGRHRLGQGEVEGGGKA